ncbi:MAG: MerR family DNA-binding protein [Streptosporangiales bacterium]
MTVLRVIKAAQRLGFTLAEVAELLQVGAHVHRPARRPRGLQQRAAAKLAEALRAAQAAGCDDLIDWASDPHCPLSFGELADKHRGNVSRR